MSNEEIQESRKTLQKVLTKMKVREEWAKAEVRRLGLDRAWMTREELNEKP